MIVLLLLSAWLGCFLLLREATACRGVLPDGRYCFILATAACGAVLTLGTEVVDLGGSRTLKVWE